MKVRDIMELFRLELVTGNEGLDHEVTGGYCGDLLSDVMANTNRGDVWITIQSHQNIVAVAVLREMAAIVLVNGRRPDEDAKEKASNEGIPILVSDLSAFELAGMLYKAGVGLKRE